VRKLARILLHAATFGVVMSAVEGHGGGARLAFGNISAPWVLVAFLAGSEPFAWIAVQLARPAGPGFMTQNWWLSGAEVAAGLAGALVIAGLSMWPSGRSTVRRRSAAQSVSMPEAESDSS